ncbi:MAG: murein transglycosylase A [Zoogloeaceae bacterium]|jgi:membrane-bound lytic murein transglycosylase A|nr:murein transglycosylase A [Zoogloeaceae bacterium]
MPQSQVFSMCFPRFSPIFSRRTVLSGPGFRLAFLGGLFALQGCVFTTPRAPDAAPAPACPPCAVSPVTPPVNPPAETQPYLEPGDWTDLPGWREDRLTEAWNAFLMSCKAMRTREETARAWSPVCAAATRVDNRNARAVRAFFERELRPYAVVEGDGRREGTITGYYEPLIRGNRQRDARNITPVLGVPPDLLTIDLGTLHPDLKHRRLRGRLDGNRVTPYWSRAEIDARLERGMWPEQPILWVADPVEFFFLQIQGSGRVELPDGSQVRIGYADQNGHPYQSIGRLLVERGELKLEEASMQGIQAWGQAHPEALRDLLRANPSYVFFRELSGDPGDGPIGALGVPLTPGRSIAVDPRHIPLGAPVWLATTRPNSREPLNRLTLAQDTGGAIRGGVRADFFWGFGKAAGEQAGRMKQTGRMWVLLPAADTGGDGDRETGSVHHSRKGRYRTGV